MLEILSFQLFLSRFSVHIIRRKKSLLLKKWNVALLKFFYGRMFLALEIQNRRELIYLVSALRAVVLAFNTYLLTCSQVNK